ncbi:hypothetical protein VNO77_02132 [Canavalia gladiata]|uniref:Uncharacterized protein n=1 Tax=Canavalia gladiata TaxID=3824 RepID=A0AAN9RB00_CANGL
MQREDSFNGSDNYIYREGSFRNDITSPPQRGVPKVIYTCHPHLNLTLNEDAVNHPTKASVQISIFSSFSKFFVFKVYIIQRSGFGTTLYIFEAIVGRVEVSLHTKSSLHPNTEMERANAENKKCSTAPLISINEDNSGLELDKVLLASDQAKPIKTNGSKLSATAKPMNQYC